MSMLLSNINKYYLCEGLNMKFNSKFFGRCLEVVSITFMIGIVVTSVIGWFFPDLMVSEQSVKLAEEMYGFNMKKLSMLSRLFLYFVSAIGSTIMLYGLWTLRKISHLVIKSEVLTKNGAALFCELKKTILYWMLFNVAYWAIFYTAFMPKMPFKTMLLGGIFSLIGNLVIYGFFALFARIITRTARLQEDQDLTV